MLLEMQSYNSKYTETTSKLCLLTLASCITAHSANSKLTGSDYTQFSNELPDAPFLVGKYVVCVIHVWS